MMTKEEIGQIIKKARLKAGFTQTEVAAKLGRPQQTIANWEVGRSQPDANTLFELFQTLDADLNESFGFSPGTRVKKIAPYSSAAMQLARDYDEKLDAWGRKQVRDVADNEISRCEDETRFLEETAPPAEEEPKVIPLYRVPAAAGYASPIFGSDFDYYTLKPEDPQGAVFAIRVQGDSMEPHFPDGSIAFCNKDPLQDGDIGVFCLDGDSFIKQYHHDKFMGMTYLFSLNRDRADADKLITRTGGQTLTCFGRVMTRRRFPVPGAGSGVCDESYFE